MQGFRRAFVITGFVILGLGSNLAWHYPRPGNLELKLDSPQRLMASSQALQSAGLRCRPNPDWSDLLVESADQARAKEILKDFYPNPITTGLSHWQTPPALLAELARLPGVKEANVVLRNQQEAVVMLSMRHGAYAGDRNLMNQAVQTVQAYQPGIQADNVKLLDDKGSDLNFSAISFDCFKVPPVQTAIQSQLDGLRGRRRSLFLCRLQRGQGQKITLQTVLYLQAGPEEEAKAAQEMVDKALQKWLDDRNARLKTDKAWQVQAEVYPYLREANSRKLQRNWQLDRDNGLTLEKGEVKEWTLVQRTLPQEEIKVLQWGLTSPPPTPGQLALGLGALAPVLFGWCLLLPWLWQRHQLSSSASATL